MINRIDERFIWLNGEIKHLSEAKINILSPTAQFGANVFEGIRCYWNDEEKQLYAFRLDDHFKRLQNSMKMFKMEKLFSIEEMKQGLIAVVTAEEYQENIAVRQTVYIDGFGSWSSKEPIGMFIAPVPKGMPSKEYNKEGLHCCVSSWRRISDQNLSPRIKCGANYINSRMAQLEAWDNGYDCAIFMNDQGKISEGPGSCIFIVRDNKLITPSVSSSILESITRDTILKLAKDLGLTVLERDIERTELYMCDEAFLCGSAMEITAIYDVDKYKISATAGSITKSLHNEYLRVVTGKNEKYLSWLTKIY